ncbi:TatD family deoxyribonuclease [Paenibacillus sp. N10]|uniref:TatD family deoxyribonuclease n=2 Tax=Paenibacillus lutrae TaxID=2078573 RepID=A0A7X3FNK7_9BACL|nr:TatD family deoxyribonuclease [Paenibacillus lutrae]
MHFIDSHLHLDLYEEVQRKVMIQDIADNPALRAVIAVSMNLASSLTTKELAENYPNLIRPAYGFHPEQELPDGAEQQELLVWMEKHIRNAVAVGEVGLPYYRRKEAESQKRSFELQPYYDLLEKFVRLAASHHKPIILHAVYEDAERVIDLLQQYHIQRAHFHWFKGPVETVNRMIDSGYSISVTPDIAYEEDIQKLVSVYPLDLIMVETDGPWPFEGPYKGRMTHPVMVADVVRHVAAIKGMGVKETAARIYSNTSRFYRIGEYRD